MLRRYAGVGRRERRPEEHRVVQVGNRSIAAVDELVRPEDVIAVEIVEGVIGERNVTEVETELDLVLLAAEGESVFELEPFLGPELVEPVPVTQAREVQRSLDAIDADPLWRIVTDLGESFLTAGNHLVLGIGILETDLIQQLW